MKVRVGYPSLVTLVNNGHGLLHRLVIHDHFGSAYLLQVSKNDDENEDVDDIGQDRIKRNFVRCLPHSTRCKSTTRRQETRAGSRLFDRFFKKDLSNLMPNSPNQ